MIKYIVMLISLFAIAACAAHDERYYSVHPEALQKAIAECPQKSPKDISCEQLKTIASHVNDLALQLHANPQEYGKKILSLQELIAKQQATLREKPNQPELEVSVVENTRQLEELLAVVKWLESPGGS